LVVNVCNGWKAAIAVATQIAQFRAMVWFLRRFVAPFALGTIICAALFLIWGAYTFDGASSIKSNDVVLAILFVAPFEAMGLILLLPIALALCHLAFPRPIVLVFLAALGSILGVVVLWPMSDRPGSFELLPAACGALSALAWIAFNQDALRRLGR
jgi:hypothetical protein